MDPKESGQNIHNLSKSTTAGRHDAPLLHSQWHMKLRGGWNKTESHMPGKTDVPRVISGYMFIFLMGSWKSLWLISEAVVIIKSMLCEQAYPLKSKSRAQEIKDFVQHWIWMLCSLKNYDAQDLWIIFLWLDDFALFGGISPIWNEQFTYCLRAFWQEILWWCLEPGWCLRSISLQRGGDTSSAGIAGNMLRRTGNKKHKNKFPFYCLKIFSQEILLCAVGEGTATRRDQRCDKGNRIWQCVIIISTGKRRGPTWAQTTAGQFFLYN